MCTTTSHHIPNRQKRPNRKNIFPLMCFACTTKQTDRKKETDKSKSRSFFLRRQQLKSNSSLASGTDKHQQQIEEDTDTLPSANGNGPQLNPLLLSPKTKTTTTTNATNVGQHSQTKLHFSKPFFPYPKLKKNHNNNKKSTHPESENECTGCLRWPPAGGTPSS